MSGRSSSGCWRSCSCSRGPHHDYRSLDQALEPPADERAAHLAQTCAGNEALRAEVATLLADGAASAFLDIPAAAFAAPLIAALPAESTLR